MELAELNGLGFNHFPNRVAPLVCFLGDDCNFRRQKLLGQEDCKAVQNGERDSGDGGSCRAMRLTQTGLSV